MLASVPPPLLPWAAERRIVTALAMESASRVWQDGPGIPRPRPAMWRPEPGIAQARPVTLSRARSRGVGGERGVGRQQADGPRGVVPARRWPPRPRFTSRAFTGPGVLFPAVASLVLVCAGVGYVIGKQPPATPGVSALAASPYQASGGARTSAFMVSDTGTSYRQSTLRRQVRDRLEQQVGGDVQPTQPGTQPIAGLTAPPPTALPNLAPATASGSGVGITSGGSTAGAQGSVTPATGSTPSRSLVGCVMHLTGDIRPELVDRATYQSEPVYVIVVPGEAWVVGIDCTAAQPALITSVTLGTAG
jgi:hypothetical protein